MAPVPMALAIPIGPRVTARPKAPVASKVGVETRAILPISGNLIFPKGCFAQNIHLISPNVSAHSPIRVSHP